MVQLEFGTVRYLLAAVLKATYIGPLIDMINKETFKRKALGLLFGIMINQSFVVKDYMYSFLKKILHYHSIKHII